MFVNPSWNLGVKKAKYNIIALLNDDLSICKNFCSNVVSKMTPDMGIVGFNSSDYMTVSNNLEIKPQTTDITLEPIKYMDRYFGVCMFFFKQAYTQIPEEMKIVYGDNWLIHHCKKKNKVCYRINGQQILHIGSLSSSNPALKPICKNDSKIFRTKTLTLKDKIFSFEETWDSLKLRLFGITLKFKK